MGQRRQRKHPAGSPGWWQARPAAPAASGPAIGRPQIPLDRILSTAIEIIDGAGPAALSMRVLAQRLGSGTATLYRHFASKDEILVQVVDRILGEVEVDPRQLSGLSWQQACALAAEALYGLLQSHPNVVPLLVAQIPVGPNALANREKAIRLLLGNGFSPRAAARAYSSIMHYVVGFATQLRANGGLHPSESVQLRDYYRGLDRKSFPATVAVADHLPRISDDEEFRFGLQLMIEGLSRHRN